MAALFIIILLVTFIIWASLRILSFWFLGKKQKPQAFQQTPPKPQNITVNYNTINVLIMDGETSISDKKFSK